MHMPAVAQAFTLFNTRTPQIFADIDRTKAEMIGVPISRVFETMSIYLGSVFVNDFNILGRTYRVTAQADNPYRLSLRDVSNLKTRNVDGDMVPIGSVATFRDTTGPYRVPRYNLYPAAEVQVDLKKGVSSGQGIAMMEAIADRFCRKASPSNGRRSPCRRSSPATPRSRLRPFAVVFVFLLLAGLV
ncbi:efflux RND transporter permease subunit [Methylocystis parvus]|uniref:efflux RND transporter permease subunit n=1 Tax=Methylocystis parvus TaxID=134 RepID=UPI003C73CC9F